MRYDHLEIEPKWQSAWKAEGLYRSRVDWDRPKHYALTMLPYPSGDLHIGHWYAMTPSDARARYMRMKGFNVLFPMGFDAFGLPAENAAVQRNIHPATWTYANIDRMRRQLESMGAMFDWEREASPVTRPTTGGPSGSSSRWSPTASPTGARPWSTGLPPCRRCWPTSR
jgi:leucyl-tRNA synthetase